MRESIQEGVQSRKGPRWSLWLHVGLEGQRAGLGKYSKAKRPLDFRVMARRRQGRGGSVGDILQGGSQTGGGEVERRPDICHNSGRSSGLGKKDSTLAK